MTSSPLGSDRSASTSTTASSCEPATTWLRSAGETRPHSPAGQDDAGGPDCHRDPESEPPKTVENGDLSAEHLGRSARACSRQLGGVVKVAQAGGIPASTSPARLPKPAPGLNLNIMTILFLLSQVINIDIEDLEDAGFFKLGHQKRLVLGVKKLTSLLRDQKPPQSKRAESSTREQFSTFHPPPQGGGGSELGGGGKRQTERMARLVATWAAEQDRTTPSPPPPPYPENHNFCPKNPPESNLCQQEQLHHLSCPPPLPAKHRPVARITGQRPHGWRPHQAAASPSSKIPLWNPAALTSSSMSTSPKSPGISIGYLSKGQASLQREDAMSQVDPKMSFPTEVSRLRSSRSTGDVLQDIGSMLSDLTRELDSIITADVENNI